MSIQSEITRDFVETFSGKDEKYDSVMLRLAIISGPPLGVDPEDAGVIKIIKKAIQATKLAPHQDWNEIFRLNSDIQD